MFTTLPQTVDDFMALSWEQIVPFFDDLRARDLTADTAPMWLADWTRLSELIMETYARLYVPTTQDTTDEAAEERYHTFIEHIYPQAQAADQRLKEKLLASGIEPDGFAIPLRNLRAEADLFREKNLPLLTQERKITSEFNRVMGAQVAEWEGEERTLIQMLELQYEPDRAVRERAWRAVSARYLADREAVNALWVQYMDLRRQIAANAGFDNYRDYRWRQLLRFDYTPEDCVTFQNAIEEVVIPAARRIYDRRRQQLGVDTLRPWDLTLDPTGQPPLKPYTTVDELEAKGSTIFHRVDPQLGDYYDTMQRAGMLDLPNRKGKGPGAYSTSYYHVTKVPFIFMNAVGNATEVRTLLHEAGHAFHSFERFKLPYIQQRHSPMEFNEVASMAMELLAAPYLLADEGGFYGQQDYARARMQHLEKIVLFWPYMAVVDAFQHWVYENHDAATDPDACDTTWAALRDRFMPHTDYTGLEPAKRNGWHRKRHIHRTPFYYVEYGLAQLGAVLVWRNALKDQAGALNAYRKALALGGTVSLPDLYTTAGARFAFDADTLREAIDLIEETIDTLQTQLA
ncbi:MAG: M3 family oligoendopeptidase [Anaerolineae bacterium]|nr:M3 family oligoendopeptidase [Anaerolineae bacterium]